MQINIPPECADAAAVGAISRHNHLIQKIRNQRCASSDEAESILTDALSNRHDAETLLHRSERVRCLRLQTDLDTLRLSELHADAVERLADWHTQQAEIGRGRVAERVAEVEKIADQLGLAADSRERRSLVLTDPQRRKLEAEADAHRSAGNDRRLSPDVSELVSQAQQSVQSQLKI